MKKHKVIEVNGEFVPIGDKGTINHRQGMNPLVFIIICFFGLLFLYCTYFLAFKYQIAMHKFYFYEYIYDEDRIP